MTHSPHSVKVVGQIVNRIQDHGQNLVGSIEMAQIGPGIAGTDATMAAGVERTFVLSVARLFDRYPARGGKKEPVAGGASGQNTVHHVDTHGGVLRNLFRCAYSHQIARPVGRSEEHTSEL